MLRPSPNHGTQRLPNDDDDDIGISFFLKNDVIGATFRGTEHMEPSVKLTIRSTPAGGDLRVWHRESIPPGATVNRLQSARPCFSHPVVSPVWTTRQESPRR